MLNQPVEVNMFEKFKPDLIRAVTDSGRALGRLSQEGVRVAPACDHGAEAGSDWLGWLAARSVVLLDDGYIQRSSLHPEAVRATLQMADHITLWDSVCDPKPLLPMIVDRGMDVLVVVITVPARFAEWVSLAEREAACGVTMTMLRRPEILVH